MVWFLLTYLLIGSTFTLLMFRGNRPDNLLQGVGTFVVLSVCWLPGCLYAGYEVLRDQLR